MCIVPTKIAYAIKMRATCKVTSRLKAKQATTY